MSTDINPLSEPGERETCYRFLARVFYESPDDEFLEFIVGPTSFIEWAKALSIEPAELSFPADSSRPSLDSVRLEFNALLKVPGARYIIPFEAAFRDQRLINDKVRTGLLVGPSTDDVIRYYRVAGMDVSPDFLELPDHISLELQFMAHLCRCEGSAGDDEELASMIRLTQWGFLHDHLHQWSDPLAERIRLCGTSGVYSILARLLSAFVGADYARLRADEAVQKTFAARREKQGQESPY